MAERRMVSKKIVDSDAFMDMALSTQALYFHLLARADDDGFVGNPKKIMRMIGASEDEYKFLIGKRFILTFSSGVCVIKHWLIHNLIRNDRYHETQYLEEKHQIKVKDNNAYTEVDTNGIPSVYQLEPESSIGKVRLGKVSEEYVASFSKFWDSYPKRENRKGCEGKWKSKKLDTKIDEILFFIEKAKVSDRWKKGFVKAPLVFLNQESWNDDLSAYSDIKKTNGSIDLKTKK